MTPHHGRQRPDRRKEPNPPFPRNKSTHTTHKNHPHGHQQTPDERKFEFLQEFWDLIEEGRVGDFFGSSTPTHVDAEHVGQEGLRYVEGDAAEEDCKERYPLEVLDDYGCVSGKEVDGDGDLSESRG